MNLSLFRSLFCALFFVLQVNAFTTTSFRSKLSSSSFISSSSSSKMVSVPESADFLQSSSQFLSVVTPKPEGYVYGAVAAPDWVLPVTAVLVILTAAIPFLLRPGEQALEQQRVDEASKNSQFNKRKNKDL